MQYKTLVLSGGGILGIAEVGAISILEEYLKEVENVAGTSVGSLIATMIACGADISYIKNIFFSLDLSKYEEGSSWPLGNEYRWYNYYGKCYGIKLMQLYEKVLLELVGNSEITFQQLYQLKNRKLYMVGSNVTKKCPEYFSTDFTPDMPVKVALRISTCYPFEYVPVLHKDCLYCDGGLTDNYMINYFKNTLDSTIGLQIISNNDIVDRDPSPIKNFEDYVSNMFWMVMELSDKFTHNEKSDKATIKLYTGSFNSMDFNISLAQKDQLYQIGIDAAKNYLHLID
jgi:NTE family protein